MEPEGRDRDDLRKLWHHPIKLQKLLTINLLKGYRLALYANVVISVINQLRFRFNKVPVQQGSGSTRFRFNKVPVQQGSGSTRFRCKGVGPFWPLYNIIIDMGGVRWERCFN